MIINTAKADAIVRALQDNLEIRLAGSSTIDTVRAARDSNGYPCLFLSDAGNEAAGQPVIFIRVKQVDAGSKDVFNNALMAYAPHQMDIAYELTAGGKPTPSELDVWKATFEGFNFGTLINQIQIANTVAVTIANVDAATPAQQLEWLRWPTKEV